LDTDHTKLVEICGETVFLRLRDAYVQEGSQNIFKIEKILKL
jgi:hypothetical protein